MKRNKLIGLLSLCLLAATFASCEDWNETEAVKQKVERPEDQNPELWAEYTAALRDYKQSEHFIVYARLFNSPQPGTSEKDFMRCLPDSLDIVSLTNAITAPKLYLPDKILLARQDGHSGRIPCEPVGHIVQCQCLPEPKKQASPPHNLSYEKY